MTPLERKHKLLMSVCYPGRVRLSTYLSIYPEHLLGSLGHNLGEHPSMKRIESKSPNLRLIPTRREATGIFEGNEYYFDEPDFITILNRERKRSQRSMKPLVLMCFDVSGMMIPNNTHEHRILRKAFATCIRETDVQGWYKQESIMGILFTEIESPSPSVRESIFRRVMAHLVSQSGPGVLYKVKVTLHIYPADKANDDTVDRYDMRYYKYHVSKTDKCNLSERIDSKVDGANNCKTFTSLIIESLE